MKKKFTVTLVAYQTVEVEADSPAGAEVRAYKEGYCDPDVDWTTEKITEGWAD